MRYSANCLIWLTTFLAVSGISPHCFAQAADKSKPILEFRLAESESAEGLVEAQIANGGETIYLHSEGIVPLEQIAEVVRSKDPNSGSDQIAIRFTKQGGELLNKATESNVGKRIAIVFKGQVILAPIIREKFSQNVVINGLFSETELNEVIAALKSKPEQPSKSGKLFSKEGLQDFARLLVKLEVEKKLNGTILIAHKGEIVFENIMGYANIEEGTPLRRNSSFRLASVSKQFTAMGIMILKEQGKLNYDDDIRKFLPELPYEGITIRHLLNHTGGLPDYMRLFNLHWDTDNPIIKRKIAFNRDAVELFAKHKPEVLFKPGEKWKYSNTGYVLLGSIIEKASQQPIQEFFQEQIFEPLEMNDSRAFSPNDDFVLDSRVYGFFYRFDGKGHGANDWHFLNGMVGDGGIYSSARDMLKWEQSLYGERLVKKSTLEEAFTSGKLNDGSETGYGFGWQIGKTPSGDRQLSHAGRWVGFGAFISREPENRVTVILLTNNSINNMSPVFDGLKKLRNTE